MKRYIQPTTEIVVLNTQVQILAGSGPEGAELHETGFDSNSAALSRGGSGSLWDDDEE